MVYRSDGEKVERLVWMQVDESAVRRVDERAD